MLLGDIIKRYRSEHNLSLQDFANLIDSSRGYIHMLEKNFNPSTKKPISPSLDTLKSLADAMKTDVDTLLKQLDSEQEIILDEKLYKGQFDNKKKPIKIPVLGKVIAGIPIEAVEEILDYEEITEEMASKGDFFGLVVKGDSMFPWIIETDVIIVKKQEDCESGQVAVVIVNGDEATVKVVNKSDNGISLHSYNPMYKPLIFTPQEVIDKPVKIIGIVAELRRKNFNT